MYAIELIDLNFGYTEEKQILKDINLKIPSGKYVCIVGHNGSGKSTFSKLFAGLVQPWSGTIRIAGIELNEDNYQKASNKLGLVFQNPDNQFVGLTMEDDIAFGLENKKVPSPVINQIIKYMGKFLNIESIMHVNPTELSGGQKQKVAIASILALNPEIVIFDESTSLLDAQSKKDIQRIIRGLVEEESKTVISITHDMEELLVADEIVILKKGKIIAHDKKENILTNYDLLRDSNLNLPFIYDLALNLKKKGVDLPPFHNEQELVERIVESCS